MITDIQKAKFIGAYKKRLSEVQGEYSKMEQVELPLLHDYAPGIYLRRILMPQDAFVIGKTHKTEHFNIILSGSALVCIEGKFKLVKAGDVFVSKAGVKKALHVIEEMIWATAHPTEETDLDELEKETVYTFEEEKELLFDELKMIEGAA